MPTILGTKDGTYSADYGLAQRDEVTVLQKTIKQTIYVLGDDLNETEDSITATPGLPKLYSLLNGAYAIAANAKESGRVVHPVTGVPTAIWEVDYSYDSNVNPEDDDDPTNKPPVIRWYGETEEEVLEEDAITGDPVQTDAEEPILITTPVVLPVLEIKRYEDYPFDPNIMLDYSHRTNSTTFWGAPAGSALMLPMDVDQEVIEGTIFAVTTYRIKFKIKPGVAEPWKARVLHHGFKYRTAAGKPPVIYEDRYGNPATVNLTAGGTKLPDGDPAEYLEWNRFEKANLNALSLGPF